MTTVLGILILVCALFLVVSVLLQSSKNHRMSGVVSGGAETFFGKQKGKTIDAKLSKATAIISVVFAALVLALYIVNANAQSNAADNADAPIITDDIIVETEGEGAEAAGEAEAEAAGEAEAENAETAGEAADAENAETADEAADAESEAAAE